MHAKLYVISVPIGNPEDLSSRARRLLRTVSLIAAEDTQTTYRLLRRHRISTPLTSYNRLVLREKTPVLLRHLRNGHSIALVCDAGTPAVADPGTYLIRAAHHAGIQVSPVPGPSAVLAALAASGFPGDAFVFLGFLPIRRDTRRALLRALGRDCRTMVLFESPDRLSETLEMMRQLWGNRRLTAAYDVTRPTERVEHTTVRKLLRMVRTRPVTEEVTLVIAGRARSRAGAIQSRRRDCPQSRPSG